MEHRLSSAGILLPRRRMSKCPIQTLFATILALSSLGSVAVGQSSQPATSNSGSLIPGLELVEDFRFDFDQPGFYETVARVRADGVPGMRAVELAVWRDLLERPRDFRGRVVMVRGVVGANRAWTLQQRAEFGALHQLELFREGEPLAVTVICTADAADVPIGAEIELDGIFVMIRNYHSSTNQVRPAALIVTTGPKQISTAAPVPRRGGTNALTWLLATAGGALAAVWMLYRANSRATRTRLDTLRARRSAEQSVADDFRVWAESDEPRNG